MQKPEQSTVVIDGKEIRITKCPPAPIDPDLKFDRWSHDDAGKSPETSRTTGLIVGTNWNTGNNVQIMGRNGRVRPKRNAP